MYDFVIVCMSKLFGVGLCVVCVYPIHEYCYTI
jgi:hypothetical protein